MEIIEILYVLGGGLLGAACVIVFNVLRPSLQLRASHGISGPPPEEAPPQRSVEKLVYRDLPESEALRIRHDRIRLLVEQESVLRENTQRLEAKLEATRALHATLTRETAVAIDLVRKSIESEVNEMKKIVSSAFSDAFLSVSTSTAEACESMRMGVEETLAESRRRVELFQKGLTTLINVDDHTVKAHDEPCYSDVHEGHSGAGGDAGGRGLRARSSRGL